MQLKININATELIAAFGKAPLVVASTLRKEMGTILNKVARDARKGHKFITRSGMAERSIQSEISPSGLIGKVFLNNSVAYYSKYLHEGTGIYGEKKRPIKPINVSLLRWKSPGLGYIFAKSVKGIKADPFIYNAFEKNKKDIEPQINEAIKKAILESGLKVI